MIDFQNSLYTRTQEELSDENVFLEKLIIAKL